MPNNFTNNVTTHLRQGLLTTDTIMRVKLGDGAKFALPIGDYAYVTLRDKLNYEVVRYQIAGTVPVLPLPNPPVSPGDDIAIIRAQDNTIARQFPVGTCVTIEWNEAQINDTVNQIAELHETEVLGTLPIEVALNDTGINKVYTVSINGTAFLAETGIIDPTVAPAVGRPPFFVNTATNDAFIWTGTAWLLLTPNISVGTANPTLPPGIGQGPIFSNTATGNSFGWTGTAWVQIGAPSSSVDLTPYALTTYVDAQDASVANTAASALSNAVTTLNAAIASAGALQVVTGTAPIASSGGANPVISHNASGVTAGTYDLTTVDSIGHVTGGTPVVTAASQAGSNSITFSNGVIFKWGTVTIINPSGVTGNVVSSAVVFPVAFPTAALSVVVGGGSPEAADSGAVGTSSLTISGFSASAFLGPGNMITARWHALGY